MCHTNCKEKVPTKCGINEKQISDILNVIHIGNPIRKPRPIPVKKFVLWIKFVFKLFLEDYNIKKKKRPSVSAPMPIVIYSDFDKLDEAREIKTQQQTAEELEKLMENEIEKLEIQKLEKEKLEIEKLVKDRIKNQSMIHYEPDYDSKRLDEFLESSDDEQEIFPDSDGSQESKRKKVTFKNFNLERLVGQGAFG